jgi:hypothetical protein
MRPQSARREAVRGTKEAIGCAGDLGQREMNPDSGETRLKTPYLRNIVPRIGIRDRYSERERKINDSRAFGGPKKPATMSRRKMSPLAIMSSERTAWLAIKR